MAIKLAMELPTCKLKEWSPLADLDFILAHTVLSDSAYAEFFKQRSAGHEVILDNSYHELGYPLPMSDLLEAAQRCNATYVISPDKVGDVEFNAAQFLEARKVLWPQYKLAVVMTEPLDVSEYSPLRAVRREQFLTQVRDAEMLCCTFKDELRLSHFISSPLAQTHWKRIHLLGCAELDELKQWSNLFWYDSRMVSMDTGKALKWALRGKRMDQLTSVRLSADTTRQGLPSTASQHILSLSEEQITPEVEKLFYENVGVLRSILHSQGEIA